MRLKTRIAADAAVVAALSAKKEYEVTPLRDGAFIYLRKKTEDIEIYLLPNDVPDGELSVEVTEAGGLDAKKKVSNARIVCGLRGERLTAFYLPRRHEPRESTAFFSASHGCVTVWCEKGNHVALRQHNITLRPGIAHVVRIVLWEGEAAKLPKSMACFKDAVRKAVEKAACPGCMHMHYGKERPECPRSVQKAPAPAKVAPVPAPATTDFGKKVAVAAVAMAKAPAPKSAVAKASK